MDSEMEDVAALFLTEGPGPEIAGARPGVREDARSP